MSVELTKDADKAICEIYKHYLERRKSGMSRRSAANFSDDLSKTIFSRWDKQDALSVIAELGHAGFLKVYTRGSFVLEAKGIIYMESRFPDGISQVLEWLAKIKNAVPFV